MADTKGINLPGSSAFHCTCKATSPLKCSDEDVCRCKENSVKCTSICMCHKDKDGKPLKTVKCKNVWWATFLRRLNRQLWMNCSMNWLILLFAFHVHYRLLLHWFSKKKSVKRYMWPFEMLDIDIRNLGCCCVWWPRPNGLCISEYTDEYIMYS